MSVFIESFKNTRDVMRSTAVVRAAKKNARFSSFTFPLTFLGKSKCKRENLGNVNVNAKKRFRVSDRCSFVPQIWECGNFSVRQTYLHFVAHEISVQKWVRLKNGVKMWFKNTKFYI